MASTPETQTEPEPEPETLFSILTTERWLHNDITSFIVFQPNGTGHVHIPMPIISRLYPILRIQLTPIPAPIRRRSGSIICPRLRLESPQHSSPRTHNQRSNQQQHTHSRASQSRNNHHELRPVSRVLRREEPPSCTNRIQRSKRRGYAAENVHSSVGKWSVRDACYDGSLWEGGLYGVS